METYKNSSNTNLIETIDLENTPKAQELVSGTFLTAPTQIHEAEAFSRAYEHVLSKHPFLEEEYSFAQVFELFDTTPDETPEDETPEVETPETPETTTDEAPTVTDEDQTSNYRESSLPIAEQFTGASVSLVGRAFGINHEIPGLGEFNPPLKDFRIPEERGDLELSPALLIEGLELLATLEITEILVEICGEEHIKEFKFRGDFANPTLGTNGKDIFFGDTPGDLSGDQEGTDQFILAANGEDTIYGDAGDDLRDSAKGGHDILFGEAGKDTIYGDAGDDIKGDAVGGDDIISGGSGADELYGDAGDDIKDNGKGGNDIIYGDGMEFTVNGTTLEISEGEGSGKDIIYGDAGDDLEDFAMGGDDCIHGGRGADTIYGDAGDDIKDEAMGGNDLITGGAGDDTVIGDAGDDIQDWGRGGDDHLCGEKGDDLIIGDAGDDIKDFGKGGNDVLHGDDGNDTVIGDAGDDIKDHGMGGDDMLMGGKGHDTVIGDAGDDLGIWGADPCENGHDDYEDEWFEGDKVRGPKTLEVTVMGGNDMMEGNEGNDWMSGDAGDDLGYFVSEEPYNYRDNEMPKKDDMEGPGDEEMMEPRSHRDSFTVMGGNDKMSGGKGHDEMFGDAGSNLGFFTLQDSYGDREREYENGYGSGNGADYTIKGGDDTMYGNEGHDWMVGDAGENLGYFGNGDCGCEEDHGPFEWNEKGQGHAPKGDVYNIFGGNDSMFGGEGHDEMVGDAGHNLGFFENAYTHYEPVWRDEHGGNGYAGDKFRIEGGDDYMEGNEGSDWMVGDAGENLGYFANQQEYFYKKYGGVESNDLFYKKYGKYGPQEGADIKIRGGDDTMYGNEGHDDMSGDAGEDLGYFGNGDCGCAEGEDLWGGGTFRNEGPQHAPKDHITIKGGDDIMSGGKGDDTMSGDAGYNLGFFQDTGEHNGEWGEDNNQKTPARSLVLKVAGGDDFMDGGSGSDWMAGDASEDLGFFGAEGHRMERDEWEDDFFYKKYGNNYPPETGNEYRIKGGDDIMHGADGNDYMSGDAGDDLGFFGNDVGCGCDESEHYNEMQPQFFERNGNENGPAHYQGTIYSIKGGNDEMYGGNGEDEMAGDAGDDLGFFVKPSNQHHDSYQRYGYEDNELTIEIKGGNDRMEGGNGNDWMSGDAGDDLGFFDLMTEYYDHDDEWNEEEFFFYKKYGFPEGNEYKVKGGNDEMWGGDGEDTMAGDAADDLGYFQQESPSYWRNESEYSNNHYHNTNGDTFNIKGGNDHMYGGNDNDWMSGDAGEDLGYFEANDEYSYEEIHGSYSAKHSCKEGYGPDQFNIKGGKDWMEGGDGDDVMAGDAGRNLGYFAQGMGYYNLMPMTFINELDYENGNENDHDWSEGNTFNIMGGNDDMFGGLGCDIMAGDAGEDLGYFGRDFSTLPIWEGESETYYNGYSGHGDQFCIMGGNDWMSGGEDDDVMSGDAGRDLGFFANSDITFGIVDENDEEWEEGGEYGHENHGDLFVIKGGDDEMEGGWGDDIMAGDAGQDLGYFSDAQPIQPFWEENSERGFSVYNYGGHGNRYIIKGGNDKMWGGKGKDTMSGDAGRDLGFFGLGGMYAVAFASQYALGNGDIFVIRGGDDKMWGDAGKDIMSGDAGRDLIGFFDQRSMVMELPLQGEYDEEWEGSYKWDYDENAEYSIVRGGDDIMRGGNGNDFMTGDAGRDIIGNAEGGDDTMYGNDGNDEIFGDAGNDMHDTSQGGDDTLYGGEGDDWISGDAESSLYNYAIGGNDLIYGGWGEDFITGDAGWSMEDYTQGGNDTIYGEQEDDVIFGDVGEMMLHYSVGGHDTIDGGRGDDLLVGDAHTMKDDSAGGNDTIIGGKGHDEIFGDAIETQDNATGGNDFLVGDLQENSGTLNKTGDDIIYGNGGSDGIVGDVVFNTTTGVIVKAGDDFISGGDGDDAEALIGDVTFNEGTLETAGDDIIHGDDGNDTLIGDLIESTGTFTNAGNDELKGGLGNDLIYGDYYQGNAPTNPGVNTAVYDGHVCDFEFAWVSGVHGTDQISFTITDINLMDGDEGTDVLHQIQKIRFGDGTVDEVTYTLVLGDDNTNESVNNPGSFDLIGSNLTMDLIIGFDGDDYLDGDLGRDTTGNVASTMSDVLIGGAGNDYIHGDGNDIISNHVISSTAGDILKGGSGNDTMYGDFDDIDENGTIESMGDDTLFGEDGNDFLRGDIDGRNDILSAGSVIISSGNDFLDGGDGNDELLGDGDDIFGTFGIAGDDILLGGDGVDQLVGDIDLLAASGTLTTAGHDTLDGGAGNDELFGDLNNNYGAFTTGGNDTLEGGSGDDILAGDVEDNYLGSLLMTAGHDILDGGADIDALSGDVIINEGTITTAGNDTLDGGDGDDVLVGDVAENSGTLMAAGNDFLEGGLGNDLLFGDVAFNTGTVTTYGSDTFFFDMSTSIGPRPAI